MSVPYVYIADKPLAAAFEDVVRDALPDVQCALTERELLPKDGECKTFALERGRDGAEVVAILGDPESPVGPYSKKCWIMVFPEKHLWQFRVETNPLCEDIGKVLRQNGATE